MDADADSWHLHNRISQWGDGVSSLQKVVSQTPCPRCIDWNDRREQGTTKDCHSGVKFVYRKDGLRDALQGVE